jgi:CxxC motif-containing protein
MTELICIVCPQGCHLKVDEENGYEVKGNSCPRGAEYGKKELVNPTRVITTTVAIEGGIYRRIPVKTAGDIPKGMIFEIMDEINKVVVKAPIKVGDIIIENVLGTGVNVVSAKTM